MKRALVISGGGSKGAFAVGVLKELYRRYPGLDFDIYVGTSTGSLIVPLVAGGMIDKLEKLYTTVTNRDIYIIGNIVDKLNDTSIFDASPLWKIIQKNYTDDDYAHLLQSGKKVFINTVCLQTERLSVFSNQASFIHTRNYDVVQTLDANHFRRAMLASCCQPVFMQPIQVNRGVTGAANPDFQYVDGGVLEYVGIQMAIDAGAEEIFVIILSPDERFTLGPEYKDLLGILSVTIDILTSEVGRNDIELSDFYTNSLQFISNIKSKMRADGLPEETIANYFSVSGNEIYQNRSPAKIFKIRPEGTLGGGAGGLNFNPGEMQEMLQKGMTAFSSFAANLKPEEISWG